MCKTLPWDTVCLGSQTDVSHSHLPSSHAGQRVPDAGRGDKGQLWGNEGGTARDRPTNCLWNPDHSSAGFGAELTSGVLVLITVAAWQLSRHGDAVPRSYPLPKLASLLLWFPRECKATPCDWFIPLTLMWFHTFVPWNCLAQGDTYAT